MDKYSFVFYLLMRGNYYTNTSVLHGERVYIAREPENPTDPNAVAVYNGKLERIGYIEREKTDIAHILLNGEIPYTARIFNFKGGYRIRFLVK